MTDITPTFLRDTDHGGDADQPRRVAQALADFIQGARSTLHIAIYDFRLGDDLAGIVIPALTDAASRGVEVQIAFDHRPDNRSHENALTGDPKPSGTHEFIPQNFDGSGVQTRPITAAKLMHNKYVIRDGHTPDAQVWTGSTNFTDDAWTHQENNILTLASPPLASFYETDFDELWSTGGIKSTGVNDRGDIQIGGTEVEMDFSPGDGRIIGRTLAALIGAAQTRILVASMMLTSAAVLGALADALSNNVPVSGIYDRTQMDGALRQMSEAKIGLFNQIAPSFVSKVSERFSADGKHNFMHDKVLVSDNVVLTGSFNFSESAMSNAENIVVVHDQGLADQYATYIKTLIAAYS
ncbi:MAG: hypothetical protein JO250_08455 [Armatimonadetes bacterium]|nr:hypothetical protein [Armatimonadota bacterium]